MTLAVAVPGMVTKTGPWYNPPQFTATHIRMTVVRSWLHARHPKAWSEPQPIRRSVQRLSVRGSKLYYLGRPVAGFRRGWILLNKDPKLRATVQSVLNHLMLTSSVGRMPFVLVSNLNARPETHRKEFIEQVHTLGWKLVRAHKLDTRWRRREDLGTRPQSIEHFEQWWENVKRFCLDFHLPAPELDQKLRGRLMAYRILQQLDPAEETFPF